MLQIKLEGFIIYDICDRYVLPIYSYICPCNVKIYLSDFLGSKTPLIFRPKFFKKYAALAEKNNISRVEFMEKIPHEDLTDELKNMNKLHPTEPCLKKSPLYRPAAVYCLEIYDCPQQNMNILYPSLLESDNFEIGPWIGKFALNYWATCKYSWYSNRNFNATVEDIKSYTAEASETHLLAKIKADEQILFTEINKGFASTNIILPLINIIIEYNCPPLHLMGKIIEKFKSDFERYTVVNF
ncbi:MAG: hypothetical protein Hyperionvirus51_3 [Hyperionvirus sp.]|uniref:Uncharacterized protein n=1 Tax=Hyperionvirus sp. TaxID=2487770 RepID=A0A3G5ACF5_9VIRU|nr:MAG: hypothetical protein Hyperionvirus51_3 [Hyperionvirus sp.]